MRTEKPIWLRELSILSVTVRASAPRKAEPKNDKKITDFSFTKWNRSEGRHRFRFPATTEAYTNILNFHSSERKHVNTIRSCSSSIVSISVSFLSPSRLLQALCSHGHCAQFYTLDWFHGVCVWGDRTRDALHQLSFISSAFHAKSTCRLHPVEAAKQTAPTFDSLSVDNQKFRIYCSKH